MGYEEYESDYIDYRDKVKVIYDEKYSMRKKYDDMLSEIARKQIELHNEIMKLDEERKVIDAEGASVDRDFWDRIYSLKKEFDKGHTDERMFVSIRDFKNVLSEMLGLMSALSVSFQDDIYINGLSSDVNEIAEKYCKDHNSSHRFQYKLDSPVFNLKVDFDMGNVGFLNVFPVSLMDLQADYKTLLEHCSSEVTYDDYLRCNKSMINIDKDIDDILFSFSYKDLASNFSDRSMFISSIDVNVLKEAFLKTFNGKSKHYVK